MKRWTFLLTVVAFLIILSSCQKQTIYNYGTITATINNTTIFKSTTIGQAKESPDSGQYFYTFGAVDSSATLDFDLPTLAIGNYYFGLNAISPNITYFSGSNYYNTITPSNTPTTGSIIITSTAKSSISGTFSGVLYNQNLATDSVIITNGVFNNCNY